jgi:YNFM family putative membrane transporter
MLFLTYLTGTLAAGFSGRLVAGRSQPRAMALGVAVLMVGSLLTLVPHLAAIVLGFFLNALGFFFAHSQAAGWVTRHAKRARASATSLYLTFYYAGATLGGFYLDPFWRWAGWDGVVAASLLVLSFTLATALWLGGRERRGADRPVEARSEPDIYRYGLPQRSSRVEFRIHLNSRAHPLHPVRQSLNTSETT